MSVTFDLFRNGSTQPVSNGNVTSPRYPNASLPNKSNTLVRTPNADVVDIGTKKNNKKRNLKIALGALVTAGVGVGIYALTKGKLGGKQVQQLAEHIEFKPAKTIEEAKKFAKENLGVKIELDNLELVNFVNEGLVLGNNVTNGKSVMPYKVKLGKVSGFMGWARPNGTTKEGYMILSEDVFTKVIENSKKKGIPLKDYLTQVIEKQMPNSAKGYHTFLGLLHELGHGNHAAVCKDYSKMGKLKELDARGISDKYFTEEFIKETTNNKVVKEFFTSMGLKRNDGTFYALESPCEFIAETFGLKAQNAPIPDEVLRIYKKYGGPSIF